MQTVNRKTYTRFIKNNQDNLSQYAYDLMMDFLKSDEPYSVLEYYLFDSEEQGRMTEYEVALCHQPLAQWRESVKGILGPSKYVGLSYFDTGD